MSVELGRSLGTRGEIQHQVEEAVCKLDSQLKQQAKTVVKSVRATHYLKLVRWQFPLREYGGVLIRYTPQEFSRLDPLAQYIEQVRAEAEARLIHEQLGFLLLSDNERSALQQRALGVLPGDEADRFEEIALFGDLAPKHIMVDAGHYAKGLKLIENHYGLGTALGYGLLLAAGVRTQEEMVHYGRLIQRFQDSLTTSPTVTRTLARVAETSLRRAPFDTQFTLLAQIREARQRAFPRPPGLEFRLNRVLEGALGIGDAGDPNLLGLTALDAVLLARLMFRVRLVAAPAYLGLEVQFDGRSIYWESLGTAPLSHVPLVQSPRKVDIYELLPRCYHEIGIWNSRAGQLTKAIASFRQALVLKPDYAESLTELAQVFLRANQPDQAVKVGREAIQVDPNRPESHVVLASSLLALNRIDEAIEVLRQALQSWPDLAEAHNNLGYAYHLKGERMKAIESYQAAIRARPNYAHAYYNLGNSYMLSEQYSEAVQAYQKAVRLNPGHVRGLYNLGQAYYCLKNLAAAEEAYERVLKVNPKHAGALYNLGIIYRDKGMTEKAVETIEKAVRLNPNLLR